MKKRPILCMVPLPLMQSGEQITRVIICTSDTTNAAEWQAMNINGMHWCRLADFPQQAGVDNSEVCEHDSVVVKQSNRRESLCLHARIYFTFFEIRSLFTTQLRSNTCFVPFSLEKYEYYRRSNDPTIVQWQSNKILRTRTRKRN